MTDEERLLHLVSTDLGIPRVKFMGFLKRLVPEDRIKAYRAQFKERQAERRKQTLEISPLQEGGMYNATVDTGSPINIRALLATVQSKGLLSSKDITVTECKFKYGRFQTAVTFAEGYPMTGDASKPIVSANFKARDVNGRGISFDFHKTGKVRFSGSFDPAAVRSFFAQYHAVTGPIKVNNRVVTFSLKGWKPNVSLIHDAFSDPSVPGHFENLNVRTKYVTKVTKRKTTKLPPSFLYFSFGDFEAILTTTGTVQIQGTTDYDGAYKILKRFFVALKDNVMMAPSSARRVAKKASPPKSVEKGMPAPNVTRRGTTCPVGRRPVPYGFAGVCTATGCYIKPNPQGQPCCYKVPQRLDYSREKVRNLYEKAGIQVPNAVKKLFGITTKDTAVEVATKAPELKIEGDKIDSRQCLRYTKVALVDIARRLRLSLPLKVTKPILCQLIKNHKKMPAELLANIRKGKKLVNVRRQLAAAKIQRAFRARVRRALVKKSKPVAAPKVVTKVVAAVVLRPSRRKGAARALSPIKEASPVRAPSPKAPVKVSSPKAPAVLRPVRRKIVPAPKKMPSPVKTKYPPVVYKKPVRRSRENIYKQLNNMYARGEYANVNNFNYANQNIVEQYYANKTRD